MKIKKTIVSVTILSMVLVAIVGTVWDLYSQLQALLKNETYRMLSQVSGNYNEVFLDRIDNHVKALNVVSGGLAELSNPSQGNIKRVLENAIDNSGFARLIFSTDNGMSYSNKGVFADISGRDYFQKSIKGDTVISEPLHSVVDGSEIIVISVPIRHGEQILGVLCGVYPLSLAENKLLNITYSNDGYGFIVSKNGDIMLSSDHDDKLCNEKNLLTFLAKTTFVDFSNETLKTAMAHGKSGTFSFLYKDERRFVNFMPSTINDWYTFSLTSDTLMLQQESRTNKLVIQLILKLLVGCLLIFALFLLDKRRHNQEILMANQRFRIAVEASHAAVFEIDIQTKTYLHFENTQSLLGFSPQQLLADTKKIAAMSPSDYKAAMKSMFFHPDDDLMLDKVFAKIFQGCAVNFETRLKKSDGTYIWCKIDIGVILGEAGTPLRAVGYITDISTVKENTALLESKTQIDPLTGLYNKLATSTLINQILDGDSGAFHALFILDIDNFKGVNDTLGHAFGDAVLMDVCTKLKELFRSDDIVGRIGGDEFIILMKNIPDAQRALKKATEISNIFRQTYAGEKKDYKISCSMGIIMAENKIDRYETLFPKADAALYQAKRSGKDLFILYNPEDVVG
ncbi:MAG: diguanylate cyclase [Anaerovorax sp.]